MNIMYYSLAVASLLIGSWETVTLPSSCLQQKLAGTALAIFLSVNKRQSLFGKLVIYIFFLPKGLSNTINTFIVHSVLILLAKGWGE